MSEAKLLYITHNMAIDLGKGPTFFFALQPLTWHPLLRDLKESL
jgi:hypothetical protein